MRFPPPLAMSQRQQKLTVDCSWHCCRSLGWQDEIEWGPSGAFGGQWCQRRYERVREETWEWWRGNNRKLKYIVECRVEYRVVCRVQGRVAWSRYIYPQNRVPYGGAE